MAPSNIEATTIILDIGSSSLEDSKDGSCFLVKSIACISRIIERKIFSRPTDLISVILMGSKETNNNLALQNGAYNHVSVAIGLAEPSWEMIETLQYKIESSQYKADWVDALVVAADFLHTELQSKKVSAKKIVLMTDFKTPSDTDSYEMHKIIDNLKKLDIEPIIIGHESDHFEQFGVKKAVELIKECDGVVCSFEDANMQLKFHKKRAVKPFPWYADLTIGSDIVIPVTGFGKIRDSKTAVKWSRVFKSKLEGSGEENTSQSITYSSETVAPVRTFYKKDDNTSSVNPEDLVSGYLYGQTIVPYSKLDQTMEYQSGEKGLKIYGFTKRENIRWSDLSGDGITYVVPKAGCDNAKKAVDALVTTLNELGFVAIARKVQFKNSAPHMMGLFPIVKQDYKCLSMITLSFKEDHRHMVFPKLDIKKTLPSDQQLEVVDDLIRAMDLSAKDVENKMIFSIGSTVDPKLQHIFDSIAYRALHPKSSLPPPSPEVAKLLDVPSVISKLAKEPLEKIKACFPLVVIDKTKSGKHWVNTHLAKSDETKVKIEDLPQPGNPVSVTSVLTTNISKIGTITPGDDFVQLLKSGKSIVTVCQQMKEVIENLVIFSFSDDFSKPISAMKVMRNECLLQHPATYNEWLVTFKTALLDKFKSAFFRLILNNKLGLITKSETSQSAVTDDEAKEFENINADETLTNPVVMDTTEIDDIFADDF